MRTSRLVGEGKEPWAVGKGRKEGDWKVGGGNDDMKVFLGTTK